MQPKQAVSSGARKRSAALPPDVLRHLEGFRLGPDDRVTFFFLERFYRPLRRRGEEGLVWGHEAQMTFADNAAGLSRVHLDNRLGEDPVTGEPMFTAPRGS